MQMTCIYKKTVIRSKQLDMEHTHTKHTTAFFDIVSFGSGFLLGLAGLLFFEFWSEGQFSVASFGFVALAILIGVFVGRTLAKHLSVCDHKHIDSPTDTIFIGLVFVGSLLHTFFDGSVVHAAFAKNIIDGAIVLFAILGHEVIRTTVLYKIVRTFGFPRIVSGAIVFGVSALGIALGFFVSSFLEVARYEHVTTLISGGMFIAIATDLFFYGSHNHKKIIWWQCLLGVVAVGALSLFEF